MLRYAIQRLIWAILLMWLVTLFTFLLLHLIPGNPAIIMAGIGAKKAQVRALEAQLGLNKPLTIQYFQYLGGLVELHLGRSAVTGDQVTTDLATYLPATIELVVISFVIYVALAVGLGAWSARREGRVGRSRRACLRDRRQRHAGVLARGNAAGGVLRPTGMASSGRPAWPYR